MSFAIKEPVDTFLYRARTKSPRTENFMVKLPVFS